jgi:hypothetical protein
MRRQVLAAAWLVYNSKTIEVERYILTPACLKLCDRPSLDDDLRALVAQTLTDESFHIMITEQASVRTRHHRHLRDMRIPRSLFVKAMHRFHNEQTDRWKRDLVLVAAAIAAEVSICSSLRQLAYDELIQPENSLACRTHLHDELAHSSIFKIVARHLVTVLSSSERDYFFESLLRSARWLAGQDVFIWRTVLKQLGVADSDEMIASCLGTREDDRPVPAPLLHLLAELGYQNLAK